MAGCGAVGGVGAAGSRCCRHDANGRIEMNKLISDLAQVLAWIWMTPGPSLALVPVRDITWDIADARGAYAKAV